MYVTHSLNSNGRASPSLHDASLGHKRLENTVFKSSSARRAPHIRRFDVPMDPADRINPLTWSKCACVIKKHLHRWFKSWNAIEYEKGLSTY